MYRCLCWTHRELMAQCCIMSSTQSSRVQMLSYSWTGAADMITCKCTQVSGQGTAHIIFTASHALC